MTDKTRIIFDCERMKYPDTGLYHYCLNLGLHLEKNINLLEEELFFYTPADEQHGAFRADRQLTQHALHKWRMPSLKRFHLWHATYQNSRYLPRRDRNIKVVLSVHDLNFLYDEKKTPGKKSKYLRHVQGLIDRADALVFVSDFSRKDVLQNCDTGQKPQLVIHNGSNLLDEPQLGPRSYKPQKPFLFSIGVLHRKKNFHVLLPLLRKNTMELLIAGKPDDEHYVSLLKQRSRELGVEHNLRLLGSVTEHEKSWYFNNCKAFAFPSVSEGFGLPVVEAMSCGKPLFLSDRTALPEIGGDVSFYFRDFHPDHMEQVFESGMHHYHSAALSEKIRERGRNFNWDKAARQYLDLYRSLY